MTQYYFIAICLVFLQPLNVNASKKLFFSSTDVNQAISERSAYLNKEKPGLTALVKQPSKKKNSVKQRNRVAAIPDIAVSSLIIRPDGTKMVRVNGKFQPSPFSFVKLEQTKSVLSKAVFKHKGRLISVDVGSTYSFKKHAQKPTYQRVKKPSITKPFTFKSTKLVRDNTPHVTLPKSPLEKINKIQSLLNLKP